MKQLEKMMKDRNISTLALSKVAGLSQSYIWELRAGRKQNPSYDLIKKLAAALKCSPRELVDDDSADNS